MTSSHREEIHMSSHIQAGTANTYIQGAHLSAESISLTFWLHVLYLYSIRVEMARVISTVRTYRKRFGAALECEEKYYCRSYLGPS